MGNLALRLAEIGAVALRRFPAAGLRAIRTQSQTSLWAALRGACEELGPAFLKLGQFLSVRPDLLPPAAVAELEFLQDAAPEVDGASVRRVLEAELRAPVEVLFPEFDWAPVASASVSQVHRAVLPTGEVVAVKVQRPGVSGAIRTDLALAARLLSLLLPFTPLRGRLNVKAFFAEIRAACEAELDFRCEAETSERFARELRSVAGIRIPKIHWGWTTRRVLTAEYVEGVKISDARARGREDFAALAERGARAFLRQILEGGTFHADLHPANLLITPAGEIAYLDFGIVGTLTPAERDSILGALAGLLSRDAPLALRHLARLGVEVPQERVEAFARDIGRVIDESVGRRLADVSVARVGRGILAAVRRHGVVFPTKYALLVKALLTVEGSARALHPDFSFEEVALDYLREAGLRTLRLGQLFEGAWRGAALLGLGALAAAER